MTMAGYGITKKDDFSFQLHDRRKIASILPNKMNTSKIFTFKGVIVIGE